MARTRPRRIPPDGVAFTLATGRIGHSHNTLNRREPRCAFDECGFRESQHCGGVSRNRTWGESGRSLPRSEHYAARWQRQTGRQREADLIWGQCGATAVLCYDNSPSEADVKAGKFDSLAEQALVPRPSDWFPNAPGRACPAPTPRRCRGEARLALAPSVRPAEMRPATSVASLQEGGEVLAGSCGSASPRDRS